MRHLLKYISISFIIAVFFSCTGNGKKMFLLLSANASGINFENKLNISDSLSVLEFEYMFNGGGVALIDVNNDGLQDIFFYRQYGCLQAVFE